MYIKLVNKLSANYCPKQMETLQKKLFQNSKTKKSGNMVAQYSKQYKNK